MKRSLGLISKLHRSTTTLVFAFLALLGSPSFNQAAPNILVILADDAGYADFGFQGGGINGDFADLTPNIDSLASGGVRFSSGYVSGPVCCPSRAGLMTGRYQQRFGMEQNIQSEPNAGLPATEKTIANTLKALGHRTYALGKWHLGEDLAAHHPNQRGFDEYFGFLSGARTYFQFTGTGSADKLQRNGVFITETANQPYLTDRFGAEAAACLDAHATNHPAQSFFMYLAFNGVHTPLEADPARLAHPRIQDITVPQRKTLAAWIYRASLPDETSKIQLDGADCTLSTDTVATWEYQLRYSPDLSQWFDLGIPLTGNNALQSRIITPAQGTQRQFYRWQVKRP